MRIINQPQKLGEPDSWRKINQLCLGGSLRPLGCYQQMQPDESNRRIVFILLRRAPHDVNPSHTESSDFTA